MIVLVGPHVVAAEGTLDRVDGRALELVEERHPRGGLLGLLVAEAREVVDEEGADLGHDEGEEARVLGLVRHVAAVHEDVFAPAMPVEVAENLQVPLLRELVAELLGGKNGWMKYLAGSFPSSIEITACQRASIITVNDSIRVEHGDDFENKVLSEVFGFDRI